MLRVNLVLDHEFQDEFSNHIKLKHDNIVRLVGFCYESEGTIMDDNGRKIVADRSYRALCLEYMHNGSLRKYLSDECDRLNWHTSYKIVKGTCEGLNYLHNGSEQHIYHLDLKPENILLDKNMVAKLADFGLSKIFVDRHTTVTDNAIGTLGYMPPEYIEHNEVSDKNDIFSLGVVIIEIIMGPTAYSKIKEMSSEEFISLAQEKWRQKLQIIWSCSLVEEYCRQVKICTEIALKCVDDDRKQRPSIVDVINWLNEAEIATDLEKQIIVATHGLTTRKTLEVVNPPVLKLGMWGGKDGGHYDLTVMPRRLVSLTIRSGDAVDSILFSYIGADFNECTVGPWGGPFGEEPRTTRRRSSRLTSCFLKASSKSSRIKITLGPNEIVKEISGTHGDFETARDVIRSLTIVTSSKRYLFGNPKGSSNSFRVPVQNNGHIVGFYARSEGWLLNAIGFYIHP